MPRAEQGGNFGVHQVGQNHNFKKYCQLKSSATVPKQSLVNSNATKKYGGFRLYHAVAAQSTSMISNKTTVHLRHF